jgi:hypothetical protein
MGGEAANSKHRATERAIHQMSEKDRPPFFGTWRKAYAFAIALFAIEVALLYAFTLRFS